MRFTILFLLFPILLFSQDYLEVSPKPGDGIQNLLERYQIPYSKSMETTFLQLNSNLINRETKVLYLNAKYKLPIKQYKYNGKSIRTTIGSNDYDYAKSIQDWNLLLLKLGVKPGDYRNDQDLWVPDFNVDGKPVELELKEPLFGKELEDIEPISNSLSGKIFYLVAGHGGPDPGAIGKANGHELHEDEYAYDITLRFARELMLNSAKVYIIVQDDNDGIREDKYLNNSNDEYYYGKDTISHDQVTRLRKRAEIVNNLYTQNAKNGFNEQYLLVLHVDSRITEKRIDIFFYHNANSSQGKILATTLLETLENKYRIAQPGRGYDGSVSTRNLYMLKYTKPTAVYIELGNIQNPKDQVRLVEPNNRQAIANWLTDGVLKYIKSN